MQSRSDPHPLLRSPAEPVIVIAHRGASAHAPENTMAAFQRGWRAGVRWLETDTQPTADHRPVLLHDDDLDRTTDGGGPVRAAAYDDVLALDAGSWFHPSYAGEPPPSLSAMLDAMPDDAHVLLEIKGPHTDADLDALLAVVTGSPAGARVLLQSFERDVLARLHERLPDRPLGLLTEKLDADPVAACRAVGAVVYNPEFRQWRGKDAVIADLHAAGIATTPYTADDPTDWAWLVAAGVDGIITNRPEELTAWATRPGESRHTDSGTSTDDRPK